MKYLKDYLYLVFRWETLANSLMIENMKSSLD